MTEDKKKELFDSSQAHVQIVSKDIFEQGTVIESSIKHLRETLRKGASADPEVLIDILIHRIETKKQLDYSFHTPYFIRCDVTFDDEKEVQTLYFGRFPFTKDAVYSWVAPAAAIRFSSPGRFSYTLPSGEKKTGTLIRKDQFMIVDRRIVFMSTEKTDAPRDLVYQEYFSEQKKGFVLREIVEQMEQAQDTIIRSHYFGSFLIAGAAGSGKTTLALHRVAYLMQSPETSTLFTPSTIIVFVQDTSTKEYFSSVLPELGIHRIKIVTFDEWAMTLLNINDFRFVKRYGKTEKEKDSYEYAKKHALTALPSNKKTDRTDILEHAYVQTFSKEQMITLKKQLEEKLIDRFDLTILLTYAYKKTNGVIETVEKYVEQKKTRRYIKKYVRQPVQYSLIILDEAENYLKEQIQLIQTCINPKTNALMYVGDLVQQTLSWTVKNWTEVNEQFAIDRRVVLQKIYRNTKQILTYIQSVGFDIEIPAKLKEGDEVVEKIFADKKEELSYVKHILGKNTDNTVGILAKTSEYLTEYKKAFSSHTNVFIMTINEAQGVEFDTVVLVGINHEIFNADDTNEEVKKERQKVNHDLIYVALTRAMNGLYVLGNTPLSKLLHSSV